MFLFIYFIFYVLSFEYQRCWFFSDNYVELTSVDCGVVCSSHTGLGGPLRISLKRRCMPRPQIWREVAGCWVTLGGGGRGGRRRCGCDMWFIRVFLPFKSRFLTWKGKRQSIHQHKVKGREILWILSFVLHQCWMTLIVLNMVIILIP